MLPIISRTRKITYEAKPGKEPRVDLALSYHQVLNSEDDLTDQGMPMMRVTAATWADPKPFDPVLIIETMGNGKDSYHAVNLSQKEAIELRKFLDHVLPRG